MKKLIFEPEDFKNIPINGNSRTGVANIAQAKHDEFMKELLDGAKVVYSTENSIESVWFRYTDDVPEKIDTHQALLIDVREIENKCERHEPEFIDQSYKLPFIVRCKHCKIELEPNGWVAK